MTGANYVKEWKTTEYIIILQGKIREPLIAREDREIFYPENGVCLFHVAEKTRRMKR
jgi:hypothetical protein